MKLMFRPLLLHLILQCASQALGVTIQSVPAVNSDGVIEVQLNQTVSLVCEPKSNVSQADEELVWLRNDAHISLKDGNKEGRSSVCVTPVILEDNGATFTCHQNKNSSATYSITLNVTYGPQLSGSEELTVEEEAVLLLECDIRANPPVFSVSWTLNGSKVDLEAGSFTESNDGFKTKLSASNVEKALHEGTYQCSTNSTLYGAHNKIFHVKITEKTMKFPLMPMIAGLVVVGLTALLAVIARWQKIVKCFK